MKQISERPEQWPSIADARRVAVVGRDHLQGGACTIVMWRNSQDGVVISLDSTWKTVVALDPQTLDEIVRGLLELAS
ncbi:MAG: hypothetical protein ACRDTG_09940 [Pseudonocardiaceae bacterium]